MDYSMLELDLLESTSSNSTISTSTTDNDQKKPADSAVQVEYLTTSVYALNCLMNSSTTTDSEAHSKAVTSASSTTIRSSAPAQSTNNQGGLKSASSDSNWNVNWPDDGDTTDPSYDGDTNPTLYDANGNKRSAADILKELSGMFSYLYNDRANSAGIWSKLIELIGNIAKDPTLSADQGIQDTLKNNSSLEGMLIDSIIKLAWGDVLANGGSLADANAAAKKLMDQLQAELSGIPGGAQNSIAGAMLATLNDHEGDSTFFQGLADKYYVDTNHDGHPHLVNPMYIDGKFVGYFNSSGTDPKSRWAQLLNGDMGRFVSPDDGTDPTFDVKKMANFAFKEQFEELYAQYKKNHNLGFLMTAFMVLCTGKDGDAQRQLGGLGLSTDFLTSLIGQTSKIISEFSAGNFTEDQAKDWISQLQDLLGNTYNKSSIVDSAFLKQISGVFNGIMDTQVSFPDPNQTGPNPTTITMSLSYMLNQGDKGQLTLGFFLNQLSSQTSDGVLDQLNTLSKTVTDRSATLGTATSALTEQDKQIVNTLKSATDDFSQGNDSSIKNQTVST